MIIYPYKLREVEIELTVSTGAYSSGDAIDVDHQIANLTTQGGTAKLTKITISDAAKQNAALKLLFFNANIANATDNAAFDPTDTEIKENFVGHYPVASTDYVSLNDNSVATINIPDGLPLKAKNSKSFWFQVVSAGTPTYVAATDLNIKLTFELC